MVPPTLASLRVTGGSGRGGAVSGKADFAWCRSVVEQLDSAASACVVELIQIWDIWGAGDLAWLQSPRVRLVSFRGRWSTPQQVALVASAGPTLQLASLALRDYASPSLDALWGCNLASLTALELSGRFITSLEGLADAQLHKLARLDVACLGSLQGLEGGSLTHLRLFQCGVTSLHGLAGAGASQLERLEMLGCYALTSLQSLHACGLSRLTLLHLSACTALESLDGLGALPAHVLLDLRHCRLLTSLQSVLDAGAVNLRDLNLIGCT